jgi:hypothetical protein
MLKFLVEHQTKDKSSEESNSLPNSKESNAKTNPRCSRTQRSTLPIGSDCEGGQKQVADSGYCQENSVY